MKAMKHLVISFMLLALLNVCAPQALAQGRIAKEKRIGLSRGRTKTVRGKADPSTSYIYKIRAQQDQRLEARLMSEGSVATFSLIPPGPRILENAAGVTQWSGTLPQAGEYSIVVVVNSTGEAKIPYTLELTSR